MGWAARLKGKDREERIANAIKSQQENVAQIKYGIMWEEAHAMNRNRDRFLAQQEYRKILAEVKAESAAESGMLLVEDDQILRLGFMQSDDHRCRIGIVGHGRGAGIMVAALMVSSMMYDTPLIAYPPKPKRG